MVVKDTADSVATQVVESTEFVLEGAVMTVPLTSNPASPRLAERSNGIMLVRAKQSHISFVLF